MTSAALLAALLLPVPSRAQTPAPTVAQPAPPQVAGSSATATAAPTRIIIPPPTDLKAAGVSLDSPAAVRLRLDSTFDGRSYRVEPSLPVWPVGYDLRVQNGQFRSFSLVDPSQDLRLEVGQLGLVPRNQLYDTSPYISVAKGFRYSGPLEMSAKLQASVVNFRARLFYDDNPALDARIDSSLRDLDSIAPQFGYHGNDIRLLQDRLTVDYSYQQTTMVVGSALGQMGKTFPLAGPIDVGFVAGGLARFSYLFPNAVLDQTAGLRWRAPAGVNVGLFGGVSEGLGIVGTNVWQDSLNAGKLKTDVHLEAAPHVEVEVWGKMPFLPTSQFSAGLGRQFNPTTTRDEAHVTTLFPMAGGRLALTGRYMNESGPSIEYYRKGLSLELGAIPFTGLEIYSGVSNESISFGGIGVNNNIFMLGVRGTDLTPTHAQSGSAEAIFGGKDQLLLPKDRALEVIEATRRYADFIGNLYDVYGGDIKAGWDKIRQAYQRLDPTLRGEINQALKQNAPGAPNLDDIFGYDLNNAPIDKLRGVVGTLLDSQVYERILIRYGRHEILKEMEKQEVPILGKDVRLTAPMVLAAAHAFSLGLSPVPPITAKDARNAVDPYVLSKFEDFTGQCQGNKTAADYTDCMLNKLPPDAAKELKTRYGKDLTAIVGEAVAWHSDLIRREVNRTLLEIFLAAESLNELTVDQGKKIGQLNDQWLVNSFQNIGVRERSDYRRLVKETKEKLEEELSAEEELIRAKLTAYGRGKASALKAEGLAVDIDDKDWAPLIAFYGDPGFVDFLRAAARKLGPGKTLRVEYNPFPGMGIMRVPTPAGVTLKLPPVDKPDHAADLLKLGLGPSI